MAVDPVFEGLVSMVLQDGVSGPMAELTAKVQQSMNQMRAAGSAPVGGGTFAAMELSGVKLQALIDKLRMSLAELRASSAAPVAGSALAGQIAAAEGLVAALGQVRVVQQETQLNAKLGQAGVTQAIVGTAEATALLASQQARNAAATVAGQGQVGAALTANTVKANELNAALGRAGWAGGVRTGGVSGSVVPAVHPMKAEAAAIVAEARAGGGRGGSMMSNFEEQERQDYLAALDEDNKRRLKESTGTAERNLLSAQHRERIGNLPDGPLRGNQAETGGERVKNKDYVEATDALTAERRAEITQGMDLRRAQGALLAAENNEANVIAGSSANVDQAQARLATAHNAVISANLRLATAVDKLALENTSLSGVDKSAPYRVQVAQTEKALAESKLRILSTTNRGFVSEIEINAARLKVLSAEGKLAVAKEFEVTAARAAAEKQALAATSLTGVDRSASYKIQAAQTEKAIAESKLAVLSASQKGLFTELELNAARLKVLAASERLAAVRSSEASAAGGGARGGFFGSLSGNRGAGNNGDGSSNLLAQAGTAAKYFLMYQVFEAGRNAIEGIQHQTEMYQLAVNQLSLALDTNYASAAKVAQGYANIGTNLAVGPSVAINAAAQFARAFQDRSGAAGGIGATLGATTQFLESTGDDEKDVEQNHKRLEDLVAIAKNYGLGASGAKETYDAATVIAQEYGFQKGGTITSGTAQMGSLLKESGYSKEEGLALIAGVMQRTGQTSDAVAGDLKRLFGGAGTGGFLEVMDQYGIDPHATLKEQYAQLGPIFAKSGEAGRRDIVGKISDARTADAQAALLQNEETARGVVTKVADSPDAAAEQSIKRLETWAGQIDKIKSNFQSAGADIGNSGLGGSFSVLLGVIDPTITGFRTILQLLTALTDKMGLFGRLASDGSAALLVMAGASRAISGSWGIEGVTATANKLSGVTGRANKAAAAEAALSGGPGIVGSGAAAEAAAAEAKLAASRAATSVVTLSVAQKDEISKARNILISARGEAAETRTAVAAAQRTATAAAGQTYLSMALADLAAAETAATAATVRLTAAEAGIATARAAPALAAQAAAATAVGSASTTAATGLKGLGLALGGLAKALWPVAAVIGAIIGIGKGKDLLDTAWSAETLSNNARAAGDEGMATNDLGKIADAKSANVTATKKAGTADDGWFNKAVFGITKTATLGQVDLFAAHDDMMARLNAYTEQLDTEAKALTEGLTAHSKGSKFFGPDYDATNIGIGLLGTKRLGAEDSSRILQDLFKHTTSAKQVQQQFTPAEGQVGIEEEVKRLTSQIKREQSPLGQVASLNHMRAMASEGLRVANQFGKAGDIQAAQDIADRVSKDYFDLLLTTTNQRIASIKAHQGKSAKSVGEIRGLLLSGLTQAAQAGNFDALIALGGISDKAVLDQLRRNLEAQRVLAARHVVAMRTAVELAAQAAVEAAAMAAIDVPKPGDDDGMGGKVPQAPARTNEREALSRQATANRTALQKNNEAKATNSGDRGGNLTRGLGDDDGFLAAFQRNLDIERAALMVQRARIRSAMAAADLFAAQQADMAAKMAPPGGATGTENDWFHGGGPGTFTAGTITAQTDGQRKAAADLKAAQDKLAAASKSVKAARDARSLTAPTGSAFEWPKEKEGPSAQDIELARLQSLVIPGDPMSAALIGLRVAKYQMDTAKDKVAYYNAVKALHEAQYAFSQVQLSETNALDLLSFDRTNPLLMAREKVREAARQLIMDRNRGAGQGVINRDQLALRDAQSSAARTAFDQEFATQTTNYNLQRISLSAYLSYLNAQKRYLEAVRNKTYDQVQELNQVDQALKGLADQLQGQFNLGDIKIPTVYEARTARAKSTSVNNVQITINGTDLAAVRAVLNQYVGQAVMSTAGSVARRV